MITEWLIRWAHRVMIRRQPDLVIGDRYMLRWHILPRNPICGIYLHHILHDDEDEALHDHPYMNISFVINGGYYEHFADGTMVWWPPGSIVFRRPSTAHRISLAKDDVISISAISLFFTGPRVREWGFHCPKGWIPWHQFLDMKKGYGHRYAMNKESVKGQGCP